MLKLKIKITTKDCKLPAVKINQSVKEYLSNCDAGIFAIGLELICSENKEETLYALHYANSFIDKSKGKEQTDRIYWKAKEMGISMLEILKVLTYNLVPTDI